MIETRTPTLIERGVAALIDTVILEGLNWVLKLGVIAIFSFIIRQAGAEPKEIITDMLDMIIEMGLYLILSFPYFVWGTLRYGTTPGKLPFRIYVRDKETGHSISLKQSILRFVGYGISYLPMGGGYFMIFFQKDRRCLHDFIAGTICMVERKIPVIRIEDHAPGA